MRRKQFIILLILALGFIIRLAYLDKFPISLNQDEASQGYSAYSLLKTGKDEWGSPWPVTSFKSFLDYKAPLYTYLAIPSTALFGLNEFAIRLPSVIFGTLLIWAVYLLFKYLFPKLRPSYFPELAALLIAISPWSISFSRSAMEANLFPTLFFFGLYFFIKDPHKLKNQIITSLIWGLSLYSYHSAKIFIPLIILTLLAIYKPKLKNVFISGLIFAFFVSPIYISNVFGVEGRRGAELSVTNLSATEVITVSNTQYYSQLNRIHPFISRLANNKLFFSAHKFISNYLSYFSPSYWFASGSGDTSYANTADWGLAYIWQLPLLFMGIYYLFKRKENHLLLLFSAWLLLAGLPAAVTKDGYHPNRAIAFMGLIEILSVYGLANFYQQKRYIYQSIIIFFLGTVSIFSFLSFANYYFFSFPITHPQAMSNGWSQSVKYLTSISSQYDRVILEPRYELQSYLSFYLQMDPNEFQQYSSDWDKKIDSSSNLLYLDQLPDISLGKYQIREFSWPSDKDNKTVFVSRADRNLPSDRHTIQLFKAVTQEPLVEIFDFRNEDK